MSITEPPAAVLVLGHSGEVSVFLNSSARGVDAPLVVRHGHHGHAGGERLNEEICSPAKLDAGNDLGQTLDAFSRGSTRGEDQLSVGNHEEVRRVVEEVAPRGRTSGRDVCGDASDELAHRVCVGCW